MFLFFDFVRLFGRRTICCRGFIVPVVRSCGNAVGKVWRGGAGQMLFGSWCHTLLPYDSLVLDRTLHTTSVRVSFFTSITLAFPCHLLSRELWKARPWTINTNGLNGSRIENQKEYVNYRSLLHVCLIGGSLYRCWYRVGCISVHFLFRIPHSFFLSLLQGTKRHVCVHCIVCIVFS